MKLAEVSIKHPVTTSMCYLAAIMLSVVSMGMLGLDLMPDIEIPAISVITSYPGAGPLEVESRITKPIEQQLATIQKVEEISSSSSEGTSRVTVKFKWGANLDAASNDIRDKVDLVKRALPDEADNPVIFKFDFSMAPVQVLAVTADESWDRLDKLIEKNVCDELKRIPGVASASTGGGDKRQIKVMIDRRRADSLGIGTQQIIAALLSQNISLPGGHLKTGETDFLIRTPEEFSSPEEINRVIIAFKGTVPVYLQDVARVLDAFAEPTGRVLIDRKPGMIVMITKQSGENTVEISKRVTEVLPDILKNLPSDIKITKVMDSADFINNSLTSLTNTLKVGGVVVFFVILFFLRNIRASFIVSATIPTSLVITFLLMYLAGYTINTITLSSLSIALGMVVDNSIVVLDNIQKHRDRGRKASASAIFGASEVTTSIMTSTLTTIVVFVPIMFVGGIAKIIFGALAAIVSMALLASMVTALTLTPMLASMFLRPYRPGQNRLADMSERTLKTVEAFYGAILQKCLRHRKSVVFLSVVIIIATFGLMRRIGTEFMPEQDSNRVSCDIELPIGTRFEETGKIMHKVMDIIEKNIPEVRTHFCRWGTFQGGGRGPGMSNAASYAGSFSIQLVPKLTRSASPKEIINRVRPLIEAIPGAKYRFGSDDPMAGILFGGGKPFSVELYGEDLSAAQRYSAEILEGLEKVPGLTDLKISAEESKPELQVRVNREKATAMGLNVNDIGKSIETFFSGNTMLKYRESGEEYDIEIRLSEQDRQSLSDLSSIYVVTPKGQKVSLSNVADIVEALGPNKVDRKRQQRFVEISANLNGIDLGTAVEQAGPIIESIPRPPGFSWTFGGARKEQTDAFRLLVLALVVGMGLVYMVMASQFESLLNPFIIFLSIPFGFTGSALLLLFTGCTFSVIAFLGLIMLVGIVVNNGIVLISFIELLRMKGLSLFEACIQGGKSRVRPVLNTTITTSMGLLPLALSRGEGSETWVPMSLTLIGGLAFSMVVTLLLMPTLYAIFEWIRGIDPSGATELHASESGTRE